MTNIKGYRNLIKTVAITDFKLKYQGSLLGYFWSLVKPLMLFSVLYFVFTRVFKIGGSIPNYPVYLLLGIVFWNFFTEGTVSSLFSIVSKGDLIRKVYFPRIVLVLSNSGTAFLTFLSNLVIVFLFIAYMKITPDLSVFLLIPLMIELYVFILGVGLILGALYVKFRDIAHIWEVFLQALFYGTPILYPISIVPERFAKVLLVNPLAQIIQDTRFILITNKSTTAYQILGWPLVLVPYFLTIIIFFCGYFIFEKMAAKFAEEV